MKRGSHCSSFSCLLCAFSAIYLSGNILYLRQVLYPLPLKPSLTVGASSAVKVMAKPESTLSLSTDVLDLFNPPETAAVKIPRIGLGVFQASSEEAEAAVLAALQLGYRHVDTAALYRNEAAVGSAVRSSNVPREEIFVTTKLWNSDHGYEKTLQAFERSLQTLGLEYVDLYLIHSPMQKAKRLDTWRAMEAILASGKAKSIGVSNYGIHHLEELFQSCQVRPSVNQVELHPFLMRKELVQFCKDHGIILEAYSPLTKGIKLHDKSIIDVAKHYNRTPAQILIRWGIQKDFVVLPKSVKPHRIAENGNVYNFVISEEDMERLDALDEDFVTGWDPTRGP